MIPAELKERDQWVVWRREVRDGKPTKVPYNPSGKRASTTDTSTWTTFEEAESAVTHFDGIGYVFSEDDGLVGLDFDNCRSHGRLNSSVWNTVRYLDSWCEISPSATGVHVFVKAQLNGHANRTSKTPWGGIFEVYNHARYFTVTGHQITGTTDTIEERQQQLDDVLSDLLPDPQPVPVLPPPNLGPLDLDDEQLLEKARRARNGARFTQLFDRGDISGYGSQSEADLALCKNLGWWLQGDAQRVDQLFRRSALMREKWERTDYRQRTITTALSGLSDYYRPPALPALPTPPHGGGAHVKSQLDAGDQDLERISTEAWKALRDSNHPIVRIVRVGGVPSRLEASDDGAPEVRILSALRLRQEMAACATWYRITKGLVPQEIPAKPPRDVIENMLAQPNIDLPILERIVEAPVFAPDGNIETRPGYHPRSRTYYADAGIELKPVSEDPTSSEQEEALSWISELLRDFPFVSEADRLIAIAAQLGPFVRSLIDGSTPLHMFEAPAPGTGKGLLADVIAIPATGRRAATITEARNEDEWRKRITAMLRNGRTITLIDNIAAKLESPALSAALTSPLWTDRILGQSEIVNYPVRTTWLATGNNPQLSREIARRTVRCRMDAGEEHPEDRKGFRHELPAWAYEHRSELVWSALSLIQSWLAGGAKPWSGTPLGSLEAWCRTIGGIFENVGLDQFLKNLDDFRATSDEEGIAWGAFVDAWRSKHGDREVGAADLFDGSTLARPRLRNQAIAADPARQTAIRSA